ncbi:carbamoyltransferase family protein [Halocatena halophila]|uniref:carbamoyltransferase family protein n=1 Tax=Halocatena halophila TaxID=2814576 RepID=UPI002ED2F3F2
MTYTLTFKPAIGLYGQHDPSAALFRDGDLCYAVEEERITRQKHAVDTFPHNAIEACLDYGNLSMGDLDKIILPYDPSLQTNILPHYIQTALTADSWPKRLASLEETVITQIRGKLYPTQQIENELSKIDGSVPQIETKPHHACHAASAFHPSPFDNALVLTIDAKGEYDSTVVWRGTGDGLDRIQTYEHPNSLGLFFGIITEYLGYWMSNGEGKVMGLAPYGNPNPEIESALREVIDTGVDYDVTHLTRQWGTDPGIEQLEELFDRPRRTEGGEFTQWEKDLAFTAQSLLEEIVVDIVETYCRELETANVALAGGVALNCKVNQRVIESELVDDVFIQPAAHDAGLALGAGWLDHSPDEIEPLETVYLGPSYPIDEIRERLSENKIDYYEPANLERYVAEQIADGALVGWFQGRLELGPRALGNRSILADPRTADSRDRVNEFVKHREGWRPFAPSMLESAVEEYLEPARSAPFMITTANVKPEKQDEITAVLHPTDGTTRPQTVRKDQNPRYHTLLEEFEAITGVPVLLNTSFNDHAEPIVMTPAEAIKDFYGMGLDCLVLENIVIEK